jgi:predicted transcriptional regulator of viral defense system
MKHYKRFIDLGCFTQNDVEKITGNKETAHSIIQSYKKKGLIQGVKRDLFVAMSLETKQPVLNRYAIASHIAVGAYITCHSAFEYYGFANQVYYEVYVASKARFRTFEYDGIIYRHVSPSFDAGVETHEDGVRVTDVERTVIDAINDFEKIGGLEELLRCLDLTPYMDYLKLMTYLTAYNKGFLYQKVGYILEHYKKSLQLPESFFTTCQSRTPKGKRYFYQKLQQEPRTLDKNWKLYVPKNLLSVMQKGGAYVE